MTKTRKWILFGLLILLGLGLVSLLFTTKSNKQQTKTESVTVIATKAKKEKWDYTIRLAGTLYGIQSITVKAGIQDGGRITKILFLSGQTVKAGQPLFQINPHAADTTTIRAPFSGVLGFKQVDLGDYVKPGDDLVTLENNQLLKVVFSVPQTYLSALFLGQTISVYKPLYPKQKIFGKVYAFDSQIDSTTLGLETWGAIPNKNLAGFMPGMFVEVAIHGKSPKSIITLPQSAIVYSVFGNYVYKIINDKAVKTFVTIGKRYKGNVAVTDGLKQNDLVVTAGQLKLTNGDKVIVKMRKDKDYVDVIKMGQNEDGLSF